MKRNTVFFPACLLAIIIACGCTRQPSDLERRVQKLENKLSQLSNDFRGILQSSATNHRFYAIAYSNLLVLEDQRQHHLAEFMEGNIRFREGEPARIREIAAEELDRQLHARAAQFKARPAAPAPAPGVRAAEPLRDGVPTAVYEQIAGQAAKDWPGNFTMQKFVIEEESKAYRVLHPAR